MNRRICLLTIAAFLPLVVTSAAAVGGLCQDDRDQQLSVQAVVSVSETATLKSPINGKIEFLIDEGQEVQKGDLLLRLSSDELMEAIDSAKLEIEQQRAALLSSQAVSERTIQRLTSEVALAESQLESCKLNAERMLADDGELSLERIELESEIQLFHRQIELNRRLLDLMDPDRREDRIRTIEIELAIAESEHELIQARARMEFLKSHRQVEVERGARRDVHQAEIALSQSIESLDQFRKEWEPQNAATETILRVQMERLEDLMEKLEGCEIQAEYDGTVVYATRATGRGRLPTIQHGALVQNRQALMMVVSDDLLQVTANVLDRTGEARFEAGQSVTVRVDAIPDREISATITKDIKFTSSGRTGEKVYQMVLDLDKHMMLLDGIRPGMTCTVEFEEVDQ